MGSARARIGSILFEKQDFRVALDEFRLAAEAKSKDKQLTGWAFLGMAECLKNLGRAEEALRYFAKSQRLLSDPVMLVSSVWEHAHLTQGAEGGTRAMSAFSRRIVSLAKRGRCSRELSLKAIMALHSKKAFDEAASLLKSLAKVIDLDERFWQYALAYKSKGFLTGTEDIMSSLEFLPPSEQAEWHLSAGSLLLDMGYDRDAEDEVRSALQLRQDWPQANYVLGSILEMRRDFGEAKARFEAVLEHEGSIERELWRRAIGGAHYHLACMSEQSGDVEKALQHLKACLEIIPKHRKAMKLKLSLISTAAPVTG